MKRLSQPALQQTRTYLATAGRAVDQARFAFHVDGGSATAVLTALAAYQNGDGGFGHALEPDLRTPASSAVATQQGFNLLREVGATSDEPLVQRAVTYLLATLDKTPWWAYAKIAESFAGFLANPRAALIGFLWEHQALVPQALLDQLLDAQLTHLAVQPTDAGIDMHELPCYVTLATTSQLPAQYRQQITTLLQARVQGKVATDRGAFGGYQLLPLDVAPTPDALLATTVDRSALDAHLDYLLESQLPDGSWPIPWSWDFVDAAAWAQAERDWKGFIAVNRLKMLAAYGRIEA